MSYYPDIIGDSWKNCLHYEKAVFTLISGDAMSFAVGDTKIRLDAANREYEVLTK